jgi:membrane-associated phospholipid phosphatase
LISNPGKTVPPTLIGRLLYVIGVYAFFFMAYGFANRVIPLSRCRDLGISLDYAIPFVPGFIFFFCFSYILMLVPALIINDRVMLQRAAIAFFLLIGISVLIFFLFPVFVPRPGFTVDSLSTKLVAFVYRTDRPVCGFPSLHVATAVLATAILFRRSRSVGWVFFPFALLTSLSVLFVKQHVVLDFIGGLVLAVVVDRLVMGKWKQAGKGISE